MLHCDDAARGVEEVADTLIGLVEAGHARSVGVANSRAAPAGRTRGRAQQAGTSAAG